MGNAPARPERPHESRPGTSPSRSSLFRLLGLQGLVLLAAMGGTPAVRAGEITATTGAQGLGTLVNGGTSCTSGLCAVTGGTQAGTNLFHRFDSFDTRGGQITGATINNSGASNVFVGVLSPTFIDRNVGLTSPGSLTWLSPAGISIQGAGGFTNVTNLTLSTASSARIGNGVFDALSTTATQAAALNGAPVAGRAGLLSDPQTLTALALTKNGDLTLSGGLLTVDKELLLDAQGGNVLLQNTGIQAAGQAVAIHGNQVVLNQSSVDTTNQQGAGGNITLTGEAIALLGSQLRADGTTRGGQVLVGGDERGLNPAIPNAKQLFVDHTSSIRADGIGNGDGGKIVLYSTLYTQADGALSARGGANGGNGGFVETSGGYLSIGSVPDLFAPKGNPGEWLIDPWDLVIQSAPIPTPSTFVSGAPFPSPSVFGFSTGPFTGTTAYLDVAQLATALSTSNVTIATAALAVAQPAGTGQGQITLASPLIVNSTNTILTLEAQTQILLNANITNTSNSAGGFLTLNLIAPTGVAWGNAALSGPMNVSVKTSAASMMNDGLIQVTGSGSFLGAAGRTNILNARSMTIPSGKLFQIGSSTYVNLDGISPAVNVNALSGLYLQGGLTLDAGSSIAIGGGFFDNAGFIDANNLSNIYVGLSAGNFTNTGNGVFSNDLTGIFYLGTPFGPSSPNFSTVNLYASSFLNAGSMRYDWAASPSVQSDLLKVFGVFGPGSSLSASSVSLGGTLDPTFYGTLQGSVSWNIIQAGAFSGNFANLGTLGVTSSTLNLASGIAYLINYGSGPSPTATPSAETTTTIISNLQQPVLNPATGSTSTNSLSAPIPSPIQSNTSPTTSSPTNSASLTQAFDQSFTATVGSSSPNSTTTNPTSTAISPGSTAPEPTQATASGTSTSSPTTNTSTAPADSGNSTATGSGSESTTTTATASSGSSSTSQSGTTSTAASETSKTQTIPTAGTPTADTASTSQQTANSNPSTLAPKPVSILGATNGSAPTISPMSQGLIQKSNTNSDNKAPNISQTLINRPQAGKAPTDPDIKATLLQESRPAVSR